MKKLILKLAGLCVLLLCLSGNLFAQMPMPPEVPIWDANKVNLKLQEVSKDIYAIIPETAGSETVKGIPQATTGGFIVGEKGVLMIEVMLTKRLFDQQIK